MQPEDPSGAGAGRPNANGYGLAEQAVNEMVQQEPADSPVRTSGKEFLDAIRPYANVLAEVDVVGILESNERFSSELKRRIQQRAGGTA